MEISQIPTGKSFKNQFFVDATICALLSQVGNANKIKKGYPYAMQYAATALLKGQNNATTEILCLEMAALPFAR